MPVWIVELFGNAQLNRAFWLMNMLVLPFWAAMIFLPGRSWVRHMAHPFFVPTLLGLLYVYALYRLITMTGVPPLAGLEVKALRRFVDHPLVFLVVWAHYLAVDLFLGMSIFRDARSRNMRVPAELVLCWIFGPLGLVAYVARLVWRRIILR